MAVRSQSRYLWNMRCNLFEVQTIAAQPGSTTAQSLGFGSKQPLAQVFGSQGVNRMDTVTTQGEPQRVPLADRKCLAP